MRVMDCDLNFFHRAFFYTTCPLSTLYLQPRDSSFQSVSGDCAIFRGEKGLYTGLPSHGCDRYGVQLSRYYLGLSARRKIIRVSRLDLSRHRAGALVPCAMLSIALSSSWWHSRIRRPCAGLKEVFTRFRGSVQVNNSNCGLFFKLQVKLGSRWVYACSVFIGR